MTQTVMVVEDDRDIRFATRMFLEMEGFNVLDAENGLKGLELIAQHGMPHLILLDMKMPVMNGWQFEAEFRNKYDNRSPILVMTAAGDAEQRAKDVHATGWIEKPFDLDKLAGKVQDILALKKDK